MELPPGPPQQSSTDIHMEPVFPTPVIVKPAAAPIVPPQDHVMPDVPSPTKRQLEEEDAIAPVDPPASPPTTPEYAAPQPRRNRNVKRTQFPDTRKSLPPAAEEEDILAEALSIAPLKAERNLLDKVWRESRSTENWVYDEKAATVKAEDLAKTAKEAAQQVTVLDEEDEKDEELRKEGQEFLEAEGDVMGEPHVIQRFFIKTARKLANPITDAQEDMLLFLERAELRSREFFVQLDTNKLFQWLFQMMAYSPSEFLAIRAFQALQFLLFGFEDEAYVHAPLSGGFLPHRTKARPPYTLSDAHGAYLSYGALEDLLSGYGPDLDLSASQQREVHKAPVTFAPAHNLSLVVRFVSVEALATPCCLAIPQRREYFVLFCRMLLDPLIAPAVNCVASMRAALEAICDSFSPAEWQKHAPTLALSANQCVESHILLRDLLRHLHAGERVVELRTRMCCLHLQPQVSAEKEINPAAVATEVLEEILRQLRTGPPNPSVLITKTLCINFLTDTLVRQLDTQAENIKRVKELVIQVNNKLRDKDSITLKNNLIEFQNRLDLFLRILTPKLVQQTLDRPFKKEDEDDYSDTVHDF